MSEIDKMVTAAAAHAASFDGPLPTPPSRQVAVVCCMDSRIDVFALLGLENGQAHVIRNAGGVVTDDVRRSLAISQRRLGTREIVLMHHTQCGLLDFDDAAFQQEIRDETGTSPGWTGYTLHDLDAALRAEIAALRDDPAVPHTDEVRGFVYDVTTGGLSEAGI